MAMIEIRDAVGEQLTEMRLTYSKKYPKLKVTNSTLIAEGLYLLRKQGGFALGRS